MLVNGCKVDRYVCAYTYTVIAPQQYYTTVWIKTFALPHSLVVASCGRVFDALVKIATTWASFAGETKRLVDCTKSNTKISNIDKNSSGHVD